MKNILSVLIIFLLFFTTSCFPVIAPGNIESGGAVFIDVEEGIQQVENVKGGYDRKGEACVSNFLYLITVGDASISKAKAEGNLTKIHNIERKKRGFGFWIILPFIYTKSCTIVYGE